MADFSSGFWTWFISLLTIVSIIGIFVFLIKCSKREAGEDPDKAETMGHVWDGDLEELNNPLPTWWFYWFIITLVWGVGYLIFYPGLGSYAGVLGWTQTNQLAEEMQVAEDKYGPLYQQFLNTEITTLAKDETALKIGERLYASYCTTSLHRVVNFIKRIVRSAMAWKLKVILCSVHRT